jgi:hypothetical protein
MSDTTDVLAKVIGAWSIILVLIGSIFNPLVCFVCFKSKQLRSTSTFKLLAIAALNDFLVQFEWNLDHFTESFFNFLGSNNSVFYCRFVTMFLQYVTLEFSSWMWFSISLDRFLTLRIRKWKRIYFAGMRPIIYSALLAFLIIAINFIDIFTLGYGYVVNGTQVVVCGATSGYDFSLYYIMSSVQSDYIVFLYSLFLLIRIFILFKIIFKRTVKLMTVSEYSHSACNL